MNLVSKQEFALKQQNYVNKIINFRNIEFNLDYGQTHSILINSCDIFAQYDIISTIYLEATFDESQSFNDLNFIDKYDLLNTKVTLTIGGTRICESNILTGLFNSISSGLNVRIDSNIIQFPIFDFSIMKSGSSGLYDNNFNIDKKNLQLKNDEIGLWTCALQYHECRVKIEFLNEKIFKNIDFKLIIRGKNLSPDKKRLVVQHSHEHLFLESIFNKTNNINKFTLDEFLNIKAIILYLVPTSTDYVEYPRIKSVNLYYDDKSICYDITDILEMDILDLNFFVLPVSRDFSSWKNINNALSNPHKYMTNDMLDTIGVDGNITVNIEYESHSDDFILYYNTLCPNLIRFSGGMSGLAFSH